MRENTKVILWIVVGAFVLTIFAVWGLDLQTGRGRGGATGSTVVGRVNGVAITAQTFRQTYSNLLRQYRDATPGGELSAVQQDQLRDQAWEYLVQDILTQQEIERLGLEATDAEVVSFVRNSPPPEVQQFFLDENGNFDFQRYQQVISDPNTDPNLLVGLETDARRRIPQIKLNEILAAQVHVSEWEVRREWQARHTRMLAEYVRFPFVDDSQPEALPTDDEIRGYFDEHREDFRLPEQAVVRWLLLPLAPTADDREDVRYTVESIRDQIEAGEAFEDMAKTYSEAFTARVGGDAGWIRRGQRPDAVLDAVAKLSPGQVSRPIATDDGTYLVQLVEKRDGDEPEYHIREIFVRLRAGSATIDSVNTLAGEIRDEAGKEGLEAAAAKHGLRVTTSEPFSRGAPLDSLGYVPGVARFAFSAEPDQVSRVIPAEHGVVLCQLVRRIPPRVPELDEVREQVVAALVTERRRTAARHRADGFARTAGMRRGEGAFESAADEAGLHVERTDTFTVDTPVGSLGARSPFQWAALDAEVGVPTHPVQGRDAWYVLNVTWREPFDADAYRREADSIRQALLQQRTQEYAAHWYAKLRERAKIEDYRELL